jgi:hypothetical protein
LICRSTLANKIHQVEFPAFFTHTSQDGLTVSVAAARLSSVAGTREAMEARRRRRSK